MIKGYELSNVIKDMIYLNFEDLIAKSQSNFCDNLFNFKCDNEDYFGHDNESTFYFIDKEHCDNSLLNCMAYYFIAKTYYKEMEMIYDFKIKEIVFEETVLGNENINWGNINKEMRNDFRKNAYIVNNIMFVDGKKNYYVFAL